MINRALPIGPPLLKQLLENAELLRDPGQLLKINGHEALPAQGASLFIHLTARCPVQCAHCMYGSVPNPSLLKSDLSRSDLERLILYIRESGSAKLTISGGGEPFLRLDYIRILVKQAETPEIEIITSANWAKTQASTNRIIESLIEAGSSNKAKPRLALRLSLDSFHLDAIQPVQIENYVNVVRHWMEVGHTYELSIRGLDSDQTSVQKLAKALKGDHQLSSEGEFISLQSGSLPVARNILKFSGSASTINQEGRQLTGNITEVFAEYISTGSRSLSKTLNVNQANHYTPHHGVSITIDSDGSIRLFAASAPDIIPNISKHSFEASLACFYKDFLTHALLHFGLSWLMTVVKEVSPTTIKKIIDQNDLTRVVFDSLSEPVVLSYVRLKALFELSKQNLIDVDLNQEWRELQVIIESQQFVRSLSEAIQ